ncbi:MAG: hypothetical protein ACERKD_08070 [Prolixibacteraceae bacterium]
MLNVNARAQKSSGYFYITGSVKVEQGLVDDTRIQVSSDGVLLNNVLVNRTGNFRIKLELNSIYQFNFSKIGFYAKTIEIDAHVPAEICSSDCIFPPYQLSLMLFKKVPGVDESSDEVGHISYNAQIDNFDAELIKSKSPLKSELSNMLKEVKQKSELYEVQSQRVKNEKYKQAIVEADRLYQRKDYEQAMRRYRDAVLLVPENEYSRNQVNDAYSKLIGIELQETLGPVTDVNFMKYLNYGDLKFGEREYTTAKVCFEKALQIRPDDASIKSKLYNCYAEIKALQNLALTEIQHRKVANEARRIKYNELVQQGDEQFMTEQYATAKDYYAQAANQIKESSYAVLMINKIDELISDDDAALRLSKERDLAEKQRLLKARNQAFQDAVSEADRLFQQRLYSEAIEYYELALSIKSYEIYPTQQIRLIRSVLADLQLRGEEYNRLLRDADSNFSNRNYKEARDLYERAHNLITNEKYALQKISEIDRLLSMGQKEDAIDQRYNAFVLAGDQLLGQNKYSEALASYQQATMLKPNEDYPKQQIKKIRDILSRETDEQKRKQQVQSDYKQLILLADDAFTQQSYAGARSLYQEALELIPGQEYPSLQIKKIDGILREKSKQPVSTSKLDQIDFAHLENISQDDRRAAYNEAMERGNSFMKSQDWGIARLYFRRALALYPSDEIASTKIAEADQQILGDHVNEAKYAEMIKKADEAFKTGDFGVAKFYYAKAKEANPDDEYVNDRLNVVAKLAENTANRMSNKEFDMNVKKGDDAVAAQNYSVARYFYRKALSIKPTDLDLKKKLDDVEASVNKK